LDENAQQKAFNVIPAEAGIQFSNPYYSGFQPCDAIAKAQTLE